MRSREQLCIELRRDWFLREQGRSFDIICKLDDLVRTRSAPDYLLSNGVISMAVEIKRVTFLGHADLDVLAFFQEGRTTPFVPSSGRSVTWGDVTTRGVRYTDIDAVVSLTLGDAAAKFQKADWADERAIILDRDPQGAYDPSEGLWDVNYWDDDEFRDAIGAALLPEGVEHLFATLDNQLFLGQTRRS